MAQRVIEQRKEHMRAGLKKMHEEIKTKQHVLSLILSKSWIRSKKGHTNTSKKVWQRYGDVGRDVNAYPIKKVNISLQKEALYQC